MSIQERHNLIRQRLASLGYHVRSVNGFALSIVRNQLSANAA